MEDDLEEFDINACCSDDFVSDGPKGCKSDPGSLILNLERSTNAHEYMQLRIFPSGLQL